MKIRTNYVSNSSSSSFVVEVKYNTYIQDKILVTDEQIEKLTEFGFKWMKGYSNNIVFHPGEIVKSIEDFKEKEDVNLYYDVTCNEEDVYEFLFANHIPFIASIHYDDWLYVYKGGDYYEIFANFANQYLMNRNNKFFFDIILPRSKPYEKIYLKEKND